MARHKDTILSGQAHAIGRPEGSMVDIKHGGQQGYMADYTNYVSSARYLRRNVIPILVEAPRGFQDLENPEKWVETLKALVELHATSIEGLQSTLTVEMAETPFGGAGEMQQDVMNVTRERSTPTFTWPDKYGNPINTFLEGWIVNLLMDPETKYPRVITNGNADVGDLLPDYQSMTVMFIEPDPTHTKVIKAWLCTNMKPMTGGEHIGSKETGAGAQEVEHSVEFSAITQVGQSVINFGQRLLDEMNLTGANPNRRQTYLSQVTADVQKGEAGYREAIQRAAQTAI